jgi:hypothetical protein
MILQLNPPIPLSTPKGHGLAHFLIDYGPESDLYWTVFQTDSGEIWTWNNKEVRADKNISLGRISITNPALSHHFEDLSPPFLGTVSC